MKKILICFLCMAMLVICPTAKEKDEISVYDTKIYKLAETYVGKQGDCFKMATMFLRDYYNDPEYRLNISKWDVVSYEELQPGDVIYYSRSPLGTTHWAVYLGDDLAFNGNCYVNGVSYAKILNVFISGATYPVFYHKPKDNEFKFDFTLLSLD